MPNNFFCAPSDKIASNVGIIEERKIPEVSVLILAPVRSPATEPCPSCQVNIYNILVNLLACFRSPSFFLFHMSTFSLTEPGGVKNGMRNVLQFGTFRPYVHQSLSVVIIT